MPKKGRKGSSGMVYSTNSEYNYDDENEEEETLPPNEQLLYVSHDRKMRKGKTVTLIEGFVGATEDLKYLAKVLKNQCGVGGNAKEGEILLQGEHRDKVAMFLEKEGYSVKKKGG
jgi:translation initiation factor 1